MRKSVITVKEHWGYTLSDGSKPWSLCKYKMLIPKVIGSILKGFNTVFRNLKQLPLGHRCRGDVEI